MEGATPHPGERKHSLQYDCNADGRFDLGVETCNLPNLSGLGGEDCEELRKRMIDLCCLQEVICRWQGDRMLEMKGKRHRQWWSGKGDGAGGVGEIVKEDLSEKVAEVRRVSDRVMTVVVFEEDVLRLICGYAPQSGISFEYRQSLYDELKYELDMHGVVRNRVIHCESYVWSTDQ